MRSILFLTVHKAASTFMGNRVLAPLAQEAGYELVNPGAEGWRNGTTDVNLDHLAGRRAIVVGPVRKSVWITDPAVFDDWFKVMLLRDPRDVVTSFYYSTAHSHSLPARPEMRAKMLANRAEALREGVDEFVLRAFPMMKARYLDYRDRFADRPRTALFRYEQMVTDWSAFSAGLSGFLAEAWPVHLWHKVRPNPDEFRVDEAPGAHKRQVTPGDHIRKLKPETIARLNEEFAEVLDWLGYPR